MSGWWKPIHGQLDEWLNSGCWLILCSVAVDLQSVRYSCGILCAERKVECIKTGGNAIGLLGPIKKSGVNSTCYWAIGPC